MNTLDVTVEKKTIIFNTAHCMCIQVWEMIFPTEERLMSASASVALVSTLIYSLINTQSRHGVYKT